MLFLYRPRQTWMPFGVPRPATQQGAYNRRLQQQFDATRRVPHRPPAGAVGAAPHDPIAALKDLAALRASGALSEKEFAAAKAKVLGGEVDTP